MKSPILSVIIPFYNESSNLKKFHEELMAALGKSKVDSEVIYVDDGSTDNSSEIIRKAILARKNSRKIASKIISLKRNSGQTVAIAAGIDHSGGDLIAFLDADLQNDPADILKMLEKFDGFDAVVGWRKTRQDDFARNFTSKIANMIIRSVFKVPIHDMGCSLKVVKRMYLEGLSLFGESHRILPLIIYWQGAHICEIPVNHRSRLSGKSKYGYSRMIKLVIDLITIVFLNSYGTKPAYVFGTLGLLCTFGGFLSLMGSAYKKIFLGVFVHRDPLFLIAIFLTVLGIQFILMGLLAELIVRIYFESQRKKIYEIKSISKF